MAEQELLKETTPITGNTTTGTSGLKQGFTHVKGAWSSSLYMKIISVGILVLFLLFFILMIAFSVSSKNCEGDLSKANKDKAALNSTIKNLKSENDDLKTQIDGEKKKNTQLQTEINGLKKQVDELNKKIGEKDSEITSLKNKQKELENTIESLTNENNRLRQDISNKDAEISQLKNEITTRDHKIGNLTKEYNTCFYVGLGLGATNLGVIIDDIVSHVSISGKNTEIATLTNENLDLKGKIHNLDTKITELGKQLNASKEEIDHVNQLRQQCQAELAQERTLLEDCIHEKSKLAKQIEVIPALAVDSAKLQLLMEEANYTVTDYLEYRGSEAGYHKADFLKTMRGKRPNVIVLKTSTGFVFGGCSNVTWDTTNNYMVDPLAFTFSTSNHKICPIKDPNRAILPEDGTLFQFGAGEIKLDTSDSKHPTGTATADKTYDCRAPDPHNFYTDGEYFTISEVLAYSIDIKKK